MPCTVWRTREDGSICSLIQRFQMQILVWASILQWLGNCRTLVCWISCFGPEYLHQVLFGIGSFGIDCKIFRVFHAEGQPVMSLGFRHFTSLWFLGNPKFCRNIIIPADVSGHLMMNKLLSSAEVDFLAPACPAGVHWWLLVSLVWEVFFSVPGEVKQVTSCTSLIH